MIIVIIVLCYFCFLARMLFAFIIIIVFQRLLHANAVKHEALDSFHFFVSPPEILNYPNVSIHSCQFMQLLSHLMEFAQKLIEIHMKPTRQHGVFALFAHAIENIFSTIQMSRTWDFAVSAQKSLQLRMQASS